VLYATWSEKDGHHFRSACGNRRPVLFLPAEHEIWRIKDCRLVNVYFGDHGESYIPLFSADEIRRKAMAQPKAVLKRHWLRLEYAGHSRD
jgi:hypothetical protein